MVRIMHLRCPPDWPLVRHGPMRFRPLSCDPSADTGRIIPGSVPFASLRASVPLASSVSRLRFLMLILTRARKDNNPESSQRISLNSGNWINSFGGCIARGSIARESRVFFRTAERRWTRPQALA
jgi:hypothetical protein